MQSKDKIQEEVMTEKDFAPDTETELTAEMLEGVTGGGTAEYESYRRMTSIPKPE